MNEEEQPPAFVEEAPASPQPSTESKCWFCGTPSDDLSKDANLCEECYSKYKPIPEEVEETAEPERIPTPPPDFGDKRTLFRKGPNSKEEMRPIPAGMDYNLEKDPLRERERQRNVSPGPRHKPSMPQTYHDFEPLDILGQEMLWKMEAEAEGPAANLPWTAFTDSDQEVEYDDFHSPKPSLDEEVDTKLKDTLKKWREEDPSIPLTRAEMAEINRKDPLKEQFRKDNLANNWLENGPRKRLGKWSGVKLRKDPELAKPKRLMPLSTPERTEFIRKKYKEPPLSEDNLHPSDVMAMREVEAHLQASMTDMWDSIDIVEDNMFRMESTADFMTCTLLLARLDNWSYGLK